MIEKYRYCSAFLGSLLIISTLISGMFVDSLGLMNQNMVKSTTGGALDVNISSSPAIIINNKDSKFKIDFLEPNSDKIQVHVDYDFQVFNNGKEIFSAAKQIGQPLLHTAEGSVTIPFTFSSPGNYTLKIPIFGINFIPINPENAEFEISIQ